MPQSFSNLTHFLATLIRKGAFAIRGIIGRGFINGDGMADDIEVHLISPRGMAGPAQHARTYPIDSCFPDMLRWLRCGSPHSNGGPVPDRRKRRSPARRSVPAGSLPYPGSHPSATGNRAYALDSPAGSPPAKDEQPRLCSEMF